MKTTVQKPIKYRNRINLTDFYWSYPTWASEFIDGVEFLNVTKSDPSNHGHQTKQLYRVRKDSLEKVKNG
jgi:hypothetical protein